MSKLASQDKFFDLSDYGRPFAIIIANHLKQTRFTPIHVTFLFGISGIIAVYCILKEQFYWASFFIILKSILDAADGELSRVKNTPSYTGRYLDSVFDILLNLGLLLSISYVSKTRWEWTLLAFIAMQLQGTLYNYYYVILRHISVGGDATSKIFEEASPKAFPNESQQLVDILFALYSLFYGIFDKTIQFLDKNACEVKTFPHWFMTFVSIYGLGFQLLIIAVLLPLGLIGYIIPFFIIYSVFIFVLIVIRRIILKI